MLHRSIRRPLLSLLALAALLAPARAEVVGLWVWHAYPGSPAFLLPEVRGETPERTLGRLLERLHEDPSYGGMEGMKSLPREVAGIGFERLPPLAPGEARTAVFSNRPAQLLPKNRAIRDFGDAFARREVGAYALPVGERLILGDPEFRQLQGVLARQFGSWTFTGGDDPHFRHYGAEVRGAAEGDLNLPRDLELMEHLRYAVARDKPVLAICGGHQLLGLACGMKFHPDIKQDQVTAIDHRAEKEAAEKFVRRRILVVRKDSVLGRILGEELEGHLEVSKYHHAALKLPPGGLVGGLDGTPPVYVVAVDSPTEGRSLLVEGIELDGKAVLSFQFHAEQDRSYAERRIMDLIAQLTREGHAGPVTPDVLDRAIREAAPAECFARKLDGI